MVDALSRGAVQCSLGEPPVCPENEAVVAQLGAEQSSWLEELRTDPAYSSVIARLENHSTENCEVRLPRCTKPYNIADFEIEIWVLKMICIPIVPKSKRKPIFDEAHAGEMAGLLNGRKLTQRLKRWFSGKA